MAPERLTGSALQPLRNAAGGGLGAKQKHVFTFSQPRKKNADVIIITRQAVQRAAFCVCHRSPPPSSVSSIVFLVVSEADRDALSSFLVFLLWSVFQPFCLLHPVQVFGPARRTPNGLGLIAALTAGVP